MGGKPSVTLTTRWTTKSKRGTFSRATSTMVQPLASASRPARGLAPEDALQRWADPAAVAALREFCSGAVVDTRRISDLFQAPVVVGSKQGRMVGAAVEDSLAHQLLAGTLAVSAIHEFADRREVLDKDLWEILWINYEFEEVVGEGRRYLRPEVFEPGAIPRNVRAIPAWLIPEFQHDAAYRTLVLRGIAFRLGDLQGKVVAILHEASGTDKPWRSGKQVLGSAGAGSTRMSDLFKSVSNWRQLIESNKRGDYRLALTV